MTEAVGAIHLQAVAYRRADRVGDERRHAAGALRNKLAVGVDQPDGKVVVFVDVGTERRPFDIGVDLIGDRDQAMPDHFERDGIDGMRPIAALNQSRTHAPTGAFAFLRSAASRSNPPSAISKLLPSGSVPRCSA